MKIDKQTALKELKRIKKDEGTEEGLIQADEVLLDLINDSNIRKAFEDIPKWYA